MQKIFDYVILGAGISGLAIAREIKTQNPLASVLILEKENELGMHGSGRNSGVMHSGIYYPEKSLKARVCAEGAKAMVSYCYERNLPVKMIGKVIVPAKEQDDGQIDLLYNRGVNNGAAVSIIDEKQLSEIEPYARTASGRALFSPETAVVDPKRILNELYKELIAKGVQIKLSCPCSSVKPSQSSLSTPYDSYSYGHLINATGQFADKISHKFQVGENFVLLPFKGIYYKLAENSGIQLKRLVYPVPDLNVPFLGVHSVNTIDGSTYFGPTAIPAFGREHYYKLKGIDPEEALKISYYLFQLYWKNEQGFRQFSHDEAGRFIKTKFLEAAQQLVPKLKLKDLRPSSKVGIRAQLFDKKACQLIMDFIIVHRENSTHVLNAISPAFTSAFSFSKYVIKEMNEKG